MTLKACPRPPRFRSLRQTLFLLPFLFLPYRWVWLPCAVAAWHLATPRRLSLRGMLARDGSLVVGATLVLLAREAMDYRFWLPWTGWMALLSAFRCWPSRPAWAGHGLRLAGILLAVVLLWRPYEGSPRRPAGVIREDVAIVCAGDSLTSGVRVGDDSDTYVAELRRQFGGNIANAGVANDRTADLLARLDRTVLARRPDIVLLFIGGNDYLDGTPRARFAAALDEVAARVAATGARMVVVEVPTGIVWNPYAGVYRETARRHGAVLVPETPLRIWYTLELLFREHLADPLTIDGIHLTPAGAKRVAGWLGPYLARVAAGPSGTR
jgi:lysophospholipase L1-like esterase